MKYILLPCILFPFMVFAQQSLPQPLLPMVNYRSAECDNISDHGEKILCYIKYDYNNSGTRNCDDRDSRPGFLCSGLIIRATSSDISRSYDSWNPSPSSVASGGVSFSYLRKDAKFPRLVENEVTGFIFYPVLFTPTNKDQNIIILCGFPVDAGTDARSNKGCGPRGTVASSRPCPDLGIITGIQWYTINYTQANSDRERTCGFVLEPTTDVNTSDQFQGMIDAHNLLGWTSYNALNELRLETWSQNKSDIPVEAFFYISGSQSGLLSSQKDQRDFYKKFGEIIPIIQITLPAIENSDAAFYYNTIDQVIKTSNTSAALQKG